jgi:hypothetical protein
VVQAPPAVMSPPAQPVQPAPTTVTVETNGDGSSGSAS